MARFESSFKFYQHLQNHRGYFKTTFAHSIIGNSVVFPFAQQERDVNTDSITSKGIFVHFRIINIMLFDLIVT